MTRNTACSAAAPPVSRGPLDQEVAEAAVPGQDGPVLAPVLAVVTAETSGGEPVALVVRKVLPADLHVRVVVPVIGPLERIDRRGDRRLPVLGHGRISLAIEFPDRPVDALPRLIPRCIGRLERLDGDALDLRQARIDEPHAEHRVQDDVRRIVGMALPVVAVNAIHPSCPGLCHLRIGKLRSRAAVHPLLPVKPFDADPGDIDPLRIGRGIDGSPRWCWNASASSAAAPA